PGRIEAIRTAEVRARTNGIVLRRLYEEGSNVREGQPLFEIDPREYRAQVAQGQAALQRAVAARTNAASVLARYRPLMADRSVSGQEFDEATSTLRQAEAQVAEARAALAQNQLQLSYTTVRAPIAGIAGRAEVTQGALVSGTEATLMTRVDQSAPVYATFTQSSSAILDTLAQIRSGDLRLRGGIGAIQVKLILENGSDYGPAGHFDFASAVVDPQTGSQTLRAVFPNRQNLLRPGQFVRGRLIAGTVRGGITVPQRAVKFEGSQASVSVLGADGSVQSRPIELGAQIADRWIVQSGLKAGQRIVLDGWQKVRPGQKVRVAPEGAAPRGAPPANPPQAQPAAPSAAKAR
ncbi:MAG: efflux RND transporter periplasmic adaptor subunit, partial [Sphingomonas sp.]